MREDGALCGAGWGARVRGLSLSVSGLGAAGVVDCFLCFRRGLAWIEVALAPGGVFGLKRFRRVG